MKLENDSSMLDRHIIEAVTPIVDCGRYPAKRIAGDRCAVEADIFRDGHDIIRAAVKWRRKDESAFQESRMTLADNDRWRGEFPVGENARYVFTIEAWTDRFASWLADFTKKVDAHHASARDLLEGIGLLEALVARCRSVDKAYIAQVLKQLRAVSAADPANALSVLSTPELREIAQRMGERAEANTYPRLLEVIADRPRARRGAWYEMFPRSQGTIPGRASTLREAERRLPDIHAMGFDVVYLPPIHPIGMTNRKGANNALAAGVLNPGSPWAIGSDAGGHDAVDPGLGTLADFDHFVNAAQFNGLEVALDFAIQCSPDHPWVRRHPAWFRHRPDGSIKYAENPPKEYQDIYPINFETREQRALMEELRNIVVFWIEHGVKIFRVDNPHTKPVKFWEWLIGEVQGQYLDVIFLAEAFTRPKMMKALAKAGFSQSYTYFTWRNSKTELTEYLTELTQTEMREYFRPNFFTNTPDILTDVLQRGGPAAFKLRLVLAATLSPSYGIYSGFELCENRAVASTEEYQNSEKYEIRVRDWNKPGNIKDLITRVNRIRHENAALWEFENLRFLPADNPAILFYAKLSEDRGNALLIAVNLDPFAWHECTVTVPADLGINPSGGYRVTDLLSGAVYTWSERNYVRLDPQVAPAHILRVDLPQ